MQQLPVSCLATSTFISFQRPFFAIDPTSQSWIWIESAIRDLGIQRIFCGEDFIRKFRENTDFDIVDVLEVDERTLHVKILCLNNLSTPKVIPCPVPDLVYVVQTSGTSGGVRKTVFVDDASISANIDDFDRIFGIEPTDKIFAASPPTFDPFYVDLLLAVKKKCVLLFVPASVKSQRERLSRVLFERQRVNYFQMTPTMFRSISSSSPAEQILTSKDTGINFVKFVVLGGEPFPPELVPDGATQFFNVYGVTEMSCWQTMARVKNGSSG